MEDYLTKLGSEKGLVVIVISIDMVISEDYDLLNPEKFEKLMTAARAGRFAGAHGGPPCGTWSASRYNQRQPGPPPVRSRRCPWGLPGLSRRLQQQVDVASDLLRATVQFLTAVVLAGGWYSLEHPEDRGYDPFPSI